MEGAGVWGGTEGAYAAMHRTKPQTAAVGLTDSCGRARRLDRREAPGVERLRRRCRAVVLEGRDPHERDAVLAHGDDRFVDADVPRERGYPARAARPPGGGALRLLDLPRRHGPPAAGVAGAHDEPHACHRSGPRRPLRPVRGARAVRGGTTGVLPPVPAEGDALTRRVPLGRVAPQVTGSREHRSACSCVPSARRSAGRAPSPLPTDPLTANTTGFLRPGGRRRTPYRNPGSPRTPPPRLNSPCGRSHRGPGTPRQARDCCRIQHLGILHGTVGSLQSGSPRSPSMTAVAVRRPALLRAFPPPARTDCSTADFSAGQELLVPGCPSHPPPVEIESPAPHNFSWRSDLVPPSPVSRLHREAGDGQVVLDHELLIGCDNAVTAAAAPPPEPHGHPARAGSWCGPWGAFRSGGPAGSGG